MAYYSTGITVTWDSTTFQEVFGLTWSHGGTRMDRGLGTSQGWTQDPGVITFSCYNYAGITTAKFGVLGQFVISGGGMANSGLAILESIDNEAELNGVTRYTVTLKIIN